MIPIKDIQIVSLVVSAHVPIELVWWSDLI